MAKHFHHLQHTLCIHITAKYSTCNLRLYGGPPYDALPTLFVIVFPRAGICWGALTSMKGWEWSQKLQSTVDWCVMCHRHMWLWGCASYN